MKILRYKTMTGDVKQIDIAPEDERDICDFLKKASPEQQFVFKGISIKARNMEICEKEEEPVYSLADSFLPEDLIDFEKTYFHKFKRFRDFALAKGIWIISEKYPDGAVRDVKMYNYFDRLWRATKDMICEREI